MCSETVRRDEAVQAATFALARPGALPDWALPCALGRDMTPIAELAVEAAWPIIAAAVRAEIESDVA